MSDENFVNEQVPGELDNQNFDDSTEQQDWQISQALAEQVDADSMEMSSTGAPVDMPLDMLITPVFMATFGVLAPNWGITQGECSALGKAYADVINEFFPDMQASPKLVIIGTAVATTSAVIAPRIMKGLPRIAEGAA